MLIDSFFTIDQISETDAAINAKISLVKDHPIYQGHFPEMPVVPGVCQVEIIKEVLCHGRDGSFLLSKTKMCKFLNMINPVEAGQLSCDITWKEAEGKDIAFSGVLSDSQRAYLKIKGTLQRENG